MSTVEDLLKQMMHISWCNYWYIFKKLHLIIILCLIIRQDLKKICGDSVCFVFNQYYSSEKGESLCDWIFVNTSNEEEKGELSLCLYVKHKIV